jgi:hypothetical protein
MRTIVPEWGSFEGVLLHFLEKGAAINAQTVGGLGAMPSMALQRQTDDFFLVGLDHVLKVILGQGREILPNRG